MERLRKKLEQRHLRKRLPKDLQKAAKVLAKAQKLVRKAYGLTLDKSVRDLLEFNCTVSYSARAKEQLDALHDAQPENAGKENLYIWRCADFFGIPVGACISLHGMSMCSPK